MKYIVLLEVEGMEQLAKGGTPHNWQLQVRTESEYTACPEVYADRKLIGSFTAQFPSAVECIAPVLEKLKAREQEIQAEAYEEMMKVKERREQLLALTMNAPTPIPVAGSPFDEAYLDPSWRELATCICTGCAFQFEGRYWWGDLWEWAENDLYLFNATSLEGAVQPNPTDKVICTGEAPTRKDHVLLIPRGSAGLSSELGEYING